MSNIRKDIINHLELSNRVKEAVTEFFKENKQKDAIVQKHFSSMEDSQILCKFFNAKINIIEEKNTYLELKDKFKSAIRYVSLSTNLLKISEVARLYNISYQKLHQECRICATVGSKSYEYDDIISYKDVFTFKEEFSLLSSLNAWKTNSTCFCRYCALEHLLNLAYIAAYTKNKTYPSTWNVHKQADKQWLYKFEMRHSEEISEHFLSYCTKYLQSALSASQSLSNVTILEPSTLSKHQTFEKIKLENDMQKIVKIYERFDIRQRITNFLNLSERLMSAAEEVLVIQKNLENVVKRYEITSEEEYRILISIKFILEQNNKYLEEKKEYENAIPRLLNFDGPMENAAKNYNIEHKLLENEIENYKLLNNMVKHIYEYDKIICTLEYLNITYIDESLLLEKLYIWRKKSQSLCSCQICALEHLYNLITDITNYKGQKSHMSTDKIKKLNEEWFCEFVIRYKKKISEFSSNCKKDETSQKFLLLLDKEKVSETNTSSPDLQRNFDSLQIPNANMMSIRQKIIDYLNLNNYLEKAAEDFINKENNEETVTQKYGFNSEDYRTLDKKIEIEKKKHQYFTSRNALDKTFNLVIKTNKESNLIAIAEYSQDIFYKTVHDEYTKYNESKVTYKYDDYVPNYKVLTYNDEFSLLDKLDIWKTKSQSCTCQICALENVYYLVYIFTNINKLEQIWENEMIHGNWICEFVMRHSAKISEFSNYSACKRKDKFLTSMNAPQTSRSLAKEKDLESNTPNIIPLQCADPQIYNARIREKIRFTKRAEIMDHLSESKWFQIAAEEVINNKEEVVTVAQKYGFHSSKDREALDKRIDILKKKRKYFELKHKIEEAVKTISSDNITEVAEKYNIDKSILNEEFKKYSALENKNNYIYNPFTSDNEMLTYSQESMLLTLLQQWKNNPEGSCHCWFCALEHLCKQVYSLIKTKTPIQRNKHAQVDVNWLYEFEMRYSKEIFEILPSCFMKCSLKSRSASHSKAETSKPLQKRSRMH